MAVLPLSKIIQEYVDIIEQGDTVINNVERWKKFIGHVEAYASKNNYHVDDIYILIDDILNV